MFILEERACVSDLIARKGYGTLALCGCLCMGAMPPCESTHTSLPVEKFIQPDAVELVRGVEPPRAVNQHPVSPSLRMEQLRERCTKHAARGAYMCGWRLPICWRRVQSRREGGVPVHPN